MFGGPDVLVVRLEFRQKFSVKRWDTYRDENRPTGPTAKTEKVFA